MERICKKVTVIGKTEFVRENHHIPSKNGPVIQNMVAITMESNEGLLVNYTEVHRPFAQSVKLGDSFVVTCHRHEWRNDEFGPHFKVSHCKRGHDKKKKENKKREEKKLARLKKLGLA